MVCTEDSCFNDSCKSVNVRNFVRKNISDIAYISSDYTSKKMEVLNYNVINETENILIKVWVVYNEISYCEKTLNSAIKGNTISVPNNPTSYASSKASLVDYYEDKIFQTKTMNLSFWMSGTNCIVIYNDKNKILVNEYLKLYPSTIQDLYLNNSGVIESNLSNNTGKNASSNLSGKNKTIASSGNNSSCKPGTREDDLFCSSKKVYEEQLVLNQSCEADYQCKSNLCSSNKCIEKKSFDKFVIFYIIGVIIILVILFFYLKKF